MLGDCNGRCLVTARTCIDGVAPRRVASRNPLLQLGWPHFWLLSGILGVMLALVVLIFFTALTA